MKFGIFVMGTKNGSYQDLLPEAEYAESNGFDSIFLGERHFRHGDLFYPSPLNIAA